MLLTSGQTIRDAKVIILGSSTVGKSSIVTRLIRDTFTTNTVSTIGAAFLSKTIDVGDVQVKMMIWDTGGSERYRSMAPMYFHDAHAAIIVYDITSPQSFQEVKFWLKELEEKGPQTIQIALVGNKSDLEEERAVSAQMGREFATKHIIEIWMETSARTGENIKPLFEALASRIANSDTVMRRQRTLSLDNVTEQEKGCC